MKHQTAFLLVSLTMGLTSGCAWDDTTRTEREFGNSVRNMIAEQTANPNGTLAGEEAGDGARLEAVLEAYRNDAGSRKAIDRQINIDPSVSQ